MRYIKQRHKMGCGIACLAMITGHGYESVRRWFIDDPIKEGLKTIDLIDYLSEFGFWMQVRAQTKKSGLIPLRVFADFHLCFVQFKNVMHLILVDDAGEVYDPADKTRGNMSGLHVPIIIGCNHRDYIREAEIR